MSQTNYQLNTNIGDEGLIGDNGYNNVMSYSAQSQKIPFGRAVLQGFSGTSCFLPLANAATVLFDADFVASNEVTFTFGGNTVEVDFDSDQATTVTAIVDAINDLEGYAASATDVGGDNRTIVVVNENGILGTLTAVVTGGASQAGSTVTPLTTVPFAGITVKTHVNEQTIDGNTDYKLTKAVNVLTQGRIYVRPETDLVIGASLFYRTAGNANDIGRIRTDSDGGDATSLSNARVVTPCSADEIGMIEINLP